MPPDTATRPKLEHRGLSKVEIRVVKGSNGRQFWSRPLAYEVVDDYGTIWTRGVFDEAAGERLPTLLYGHDWYSLSSVLGRGIDYEDTDQGPRTLFEFDDFDAVPFARQAAAQINSGTLKDMSVGFVRQKWTPLEDLDEQDKARGVRERMLKAGWDEASLVIRGAVPGAMALTGVRSKVDAALVKDVAELLRKGVVDETEARQILEGSADPPGDPDGPPASTGDEPAPDVPQAPEHPLPDPPATDPAPGDQHALDADAAAALELVGGRSVWR